MSTIATGTRYARASGALWRDTGKHVLVLPNLARADVVVLGGGGAVLWRLLSEPLDVHQIEDGVRGPEADQPDAEAIADCLEDLVARNVVAVRTGGDTP